MPVEETEKLIRVRVRLPSEFEKGSFRVISIDKPKGIRAVAGRLKGETKLHVQSFLFDKEKGWTKDKAEKWVKDHGYTPKILPKILLGGESESEIKELIELEEPRHLLVTELKTSEDETEDGESTRIIEGWASTKDVDHYSEVVEPSAFRKTLKRFMKNPIVFFMHQWMRIPIGRILKAKIVEDKGLWIRAMISDTADPIWRLIEEKILRGLSIGFQIKKKETDEDTGITTLTEIELLEISVVTLPANPFALMEAAKSRGLDGELDLWLATAVKAEGLSDNDIDTRGDAQDSPETASLNREREEEMLTAEEIKAAIGESTKEAVAAVGKTIAEELKTQNEQQSKLVETFSKTLEDFRKDQTDIAEIRRKNIEVLVRKSGLDPDELTGEAMLGFKVADDASWHRKLLAEPAHDIRARTGKVVFSQDMVGDFQRASDDVLILHTILSSPFAQSRNKGYAGPQSLKAWEDYAPLAAEFRKAMDTATAGEGAEWVPTILSSEFINMVDLWGEIVPLIRRVAMPSKVFEIGRLGSRATVYLVSESTTDNPDLVPRSDHGTGKVTFTAKELAAAQDCSYDLVEDAIYPVLPLLRENLSAGIGSALEEIILNGDTTATHMDSDTTAANDRRKAWNGLRDIALNVKTAASYDCAETTVGAAAFESDDLNRIEETMAKYGARPSMLALLISTKARTTMKNFDDFQTPDKFGDKATWLTGAFYSIGGYRVAVSEHMRNDLNASGVYDGVTETQTAVILFNHRSFMLGDRRSITIEMDRNIHTRQHELVATYRGDFQDLYAATENDVAIGYNITPA